MVNGGGKVGELKIRKLKIANGARWGSETVKHDH
jgi:hypothetical protein